MISPEEIDRAIQRYRDQQLDLRALCLLMAELGARSATNLPTQTPKVAASALDMLASLPPVRLPLPPPTPPRIPPPKPLEPPANKALQSPLAGFCEQHKIESQLPSTPPEGACPEALTQLLSTSTQLGAGGAGRVLAAYDHDLRRSVALKTLHPRVLEDPLQVQAFIEEAMITGGLEHPNIVPVHSLGYSPTHGPYYTMKRLQGRALNHVLRGLRMNDPDTTQRFGLMKLLGCFVEACQAVAFAHDRGVIHCDIKPSNIMIGDFGEVTVVDWGLARLLGARGKQQARSALWSGTPSYMPPEQVTGTYADLDAQTDVWSLGAVLYEVLTLTVPFMGEQLDQTMKKLLTEPIEPPTVRAPERDIPEELERVCLKALERDRHRRYRSVQSMLRDLEAYLEGSRELRRRAEHSLRALEQAQRQLGRLQRAEQALDDMQRAPNDGASAQHNAAQEDLALAYANAATILERALRLDPQHSGLRAAASDLYWRVFLRVYPGRIRPNAPLCERGLEILTQLSQQAFGAIVQAGRSEEAVARARKTLGGEDDPWLSAVIALCTEGQETSFNQGLPAGLAAVVERIRLLKSVSLFHPMPAFELLAIAEACEVIDYPAGAVIFRTGQPGDALFVVVSGQVAITRDGATLTTLTEAACFGEIAVLDASTRTADAVCATKTRVLRLTASRFRATVAEHGDIGLSVIGVLTQRLRTATDREAHLRTSTKP